MNFPLMILVGLGCAASLQGGIIIDKDVKDPPTDYTLMCSGYKIHIFSSAGDTIRYSMVTVRHDASEVIDQRIFLRGYPLSATCYKNMLDTGIQGAIVIAHAGGAHCCHQFAFIFTPETAASILVVDKGNEYWTDPKDPLPEIKFSGGVKVSDQNHDGVKEIISTDDSLAWFDGSSFAGMDVLPLVICLRDGKYSDCTAEFPKYYQTELNKRKNLVNNMANHPFVNGKDLHYESHGESLWPFQIARNAAEIYAIAAHGDQAEAIWTWIHHSLPEPVVKEFRRNEKDLLERISDRKKKLKWIGPPIAIKPPS